MMLSNSPTLLTEAETRSWDVILHEGCQVEANKRTIGLPNFHIFLV